MRKLLLLVVALTTLTFSVSAVTYMRVKTGNGGVELYDVEEVKKVYYETITVDTIESIAQGISVSGKVGNYTFVDLGFGTKWATYNVGASKPTEYGDYFAWGETTPKDGYGWATYKWGNAIYSTITKYCTVDGLTTLLAEDDAATQNWGAGWRMPTKNEQFALISGCTWQWTDDFNGSGVAGRIGTSKANGNTIFLPAVDGYGSCWSSSVDGVLNAYHLYFNSDVIDYNFTNRFYGKCVRAVVNDITITDLTVSGNEGDYTYVDLGLESGTKWATYNVGATSPTENGDYFAWGEITPKAEYTLATYELYNDSSNTFTKYCVNSTYGKVDNLTTLLAEDDAATANWGEGWRMPTHAEQQELIDGCTWEWTTNFNGSNVAGRIGTSKSNGNTIFLPAAGNCEGMNFKYVGNNGIYWSSSINKDQSYNIYFHSDKFFCSYGGRYYGRSVRAVVK